MSEPPKAFGPGERADSVDEIAKSLSSIPLFMRELPEDGEMEENSAATVEALKSLLYDGDAEERGQNFKTQGNDNFKLRKYKEAIAFYTQGLGDLDPELKEETKRTLWCNRAACHLALGNYRACIRDCGAVLTPSDKPVPEEDKATHLNTDLKALLRCAKALIALDRLEDAKDALERYHADGGQPDAGVEKTEADLRQKITYRDKLRTEAAERTRRKTESDAALATAVESLGLSVPKDWTPESARKACPAEITPPHFDPDSIPSASSPKLSLSSTEWVAPEPSIPLIFPIFLLRPLATPPTRDLILTFHQDVTFGDQLDAFNAQHGARQHRDPSEEVIYAVTKAGRMLKVGRKLTLLELIKAAVKEQVDGTTDGLHLVEGWCLEFYTVPKGGRETQWVQEMKARLKA